MKVAEQIYTTIRRDPTGNRPKRFTLLMQTSIDGQYKFKISVDQKIIMKTNNIYFPSEFFFSLFLLSENFELTNDVNVVLRNSNVLRCILFYF